MTNKPERRHLRHSGVFIVKFQHISRLFLVFLLLALNMQMFNGLVLSYLFQWFLQSNIKKTIYSRISHCRLKLDALFCQQSINNIRTM